MCGVVGWVDFRRDRSSERRVLQAMTDTQACRGPDAEGLWVSPVAAFGHRRLAVIDLEGGKQPMVRAAEGGAPCVLTYSGEIYNYLELRAELEALGHAFETRSDTEVLLRAYLAWGPACVERLNGMFAFGIWDGGRRELLLARDRLGVKPLFWAMRGSLLLFASEPKGILAHPEVVAEVDEGGLAELLVMAPLRTPGHGIFRGIDELRPGHVVRFGEAGARVERYWQLASRPHEDDLEATTAKLRALLDDIVRRQLISDVPICTLLSGGLDSSAVTALAARTLADEGRGRIDTWSVEMRDAARWFVPSDIQPDLDQPWIDKLVQAIDANHRKVVLDATDLVEHLSKPTQARDWPGMGEMDVSLYLLFREIKKHHTVAVSGESADEVFGGYPWFHAPEAIALDGFPWAVTLRNRFEMIAPALAARLRPLEYLRQRYREALAEVPRLDGEPSREARMREILYVNQTRFLLMLLDRKDRMSMAVGLEVRVPFCDHRLVEYAWNIPWAMKTWNGREKGILRRALAGVLPDDLLWRKKSAYPSMVSPAYDLSVRAKLRAILDDPRSPLLPLVDAGAIRAAIGRDPIGGGEGMHASVRQFAYLGQLDAWLRRYKVRVLA